MKVLVSASARFVRRPDGSLWTSNASLDYPFWQRYLDVFDAVELMVRAAPADDGSDAVPDVSVSENWVEATGPGVRAVPLPCFVGPAQFVRHLPAVHRAIARAVGQAEAVMTRIPCILGMEVWRLLEAGRPYGVEVVADPFDVFGADNGVNHPLRPLMHWWWPRTLRRQCAGATGAAYVTREALQRRYPPGPETFATHFSSIHLDRAQLVDAPRRYRARGHRGPVRLVTVGSLSQLYKAPDVLIRAVGRCVERGLDVELEIVGEGVYRPMLESLVTSLGLERRVRFAGQLARGPAVVERLDGADLFVLPSKTEGLPRAMIEAMARALPCIGTAVGGIPELLAEDDLVHPGDVEGLAHKIAQVVKSPARMERMSRRNLERAAEYCEDVLRARRIALYRRVHEETAAWLRRASVRAA